MSPAGVDGSHSVGALCHVVPGATPSTVVTLAGTMVLGVMCLMTMTVFPGGTQLLALRVEFAVLTHLGDLTVPQEMP